MGHIDEIKNLKENFLEKKGRFQTFLLIVLALNVFSFGTVNTIGRFYTYTPGFRCVDDENSTCTIGNTTIECQEFKFDPLDDETVTSEFSLVCKNEYIRTLTSSLYFGGVTIGSLLCCILCDKFGRKKIVLICMYAVVLLIICLYFGNSLSLFILFRIILGIFAGGLEMCTFTLFIEYSSSKGRTGATTFFEINYSVGVMVMGGVAYKIHTWRVLTLLMSIPLILSLTYSWLIPESILWLYVNNKYHECTQAIKTIAKINKDTETTDACDIILRNFENDDITLTSSMEDYNTGNEPKSSFGIMNVLRSPILRKHLIIMITVWFSVTLSNYGIVYYLPSLNFQRHVHFITQIGAENLGYISSYFVFFQFGRRIPLTFYQISTAILLTFIFFIQRFDLKDWSAVAMTLLAKTLVASCFSGIYMYTSELFPTTSRGFALGWCCFIARTARSFESYLWSLDEIILPYIPMSITVLLALASGIATMLLPETLNLSLPNTIEEVHTIYKKPKL